MDLFSFLRRKNMSQADLSKALDTTPGNVNRWAKGDGVPSYDLCRKLLELGMTIEELFSIDYAEIHSVDSSNAISRSGSKSRDSKYEDIDYKDPAFQEIVKRALIDIETRRQNGKI